MEIFKRRNSALRIAGNKHKLVDTTPIFTKYIMLVVTWQAQTTVKKQQ